MTTATLPTDPNGTTIEARSRGSGSSHSATCQSLTAVAIAAPCSMLSWVGAPTSGFSTPNSISHRSRSCSRRNGKSDPGGCPFGGQASVRAAFGLARG